MASELTAAVDEYAANVLLHTAESAIGTLSKNGSGSLGPLFAQWNASATLIGGSASLNAPDTIEVADLQIDYDLQLTLGIDLSFLDFCLPQICLPTPFGDICTPTFCINFPRISTTVPFSSSATVTADFGLDVYLTAGDWFVDVVIQSVPNVDLGAAATLLLTAIGAAVSVALLAVPFIGPVLSIAAAAITAAFGIAEVTGLLGPIISLFVAGLRLTVYQQAQLFEVVPSGGSFDPAVFVILTSVTAGIRASDKEELVLTVDI